LFGRAVHAGYPRQGQWRCVAELTSPRRTRCRDLTRCCQAASLVMGGRPPRAEWPRRVL
jgi:hypothetical protein